MGLIKPFGPKLYKAKLSDDVTQAILDLCYKTRQAEEKYVHGNLEKTSASKKIYFEDSPLHKKIIDEFGTHLAEYIASASFDEELSNEQTIKIEILKKQIKSNFEVLGSFWSNFQNAGDSIGLHFHGGQISCVIYLKIPKAKHLDIDEKYQATHFWFGHQTFLSEDCYINLAKEGEIILFPHWLKHYTVNHKFELDGERITASGNFIIRDLNVLLSELKPSQTYYE
jgi:hypothetical protein